MAFLFGEKLYFVRACVGLFEGIQRALFYFHLVEIDPHCDCSSSHGNKPLWSWICKNIFYIYFFYFKLFLNYFYFLLFLFYYFIIFLFLLYFLFLFFIFYFLFLFFKLGNISAVLLIPTLAPFIMVFVLSCVKGYMHPHNWLELPPKDFFNTVADWKIFGTVFQIAVWDNAAYDSVGKIIFFYFFFIFFYFFILIFYLFI